MQRGHGSVPVVRVSLGPGGDGPAAKRRTSDVRPSSESTASCKPAGATAAAQKPRACFSGGFVGTGLAQAWHRLGQRPSVGSQSAAGTTTASAVSTVTQAEVRTASRKTKRSHSSVVQRLEAWRAYRSEKIASLKERCELQIGPFAPRLCRAERSPRWLAGPLGGGDLHERGMQALARKELQRLTREEQRLGEELNECPFAPNRSGGSTSPSPRSPSVTAERAAAFYEQQLAWREAQLEAQNRRPRRSWCSSFNQRSGHGGGS